MKRTVHPKLPPLSSTYIILPSQPDNYNSHLVTLVKIPGNPMISPEPMQIISVPPTTSPPPPGVTSQPAMFPSHLTENLGPVVPVSAPIQFKQEKEHEREDETCKTPGNENDETAVDETGETAVDETGETAVDETGETAVDETGETAEDELETFHCYKELGEKLGSLLSSFKNKNIKLNAEKVVLTAQLRESEATNAFLNDKIGEVVKQAQEDVEKAKSQEALWTFKYMELLENTSSLEKELKKEIDSLKKTFSEKDKQINEQNIKLTIFSELEIKLNGKLADHKKEINSLKDKYNRKCDQVIKSEEEIKRTDTKNKELQRRIDSFLKTDKANRTCIHNLESERDGLKVKVEELKTTISKKSDDISKISQELEKVRNENQVKGLELEEKAKSVKDLEKEVKVIQKENDELPNEFNTYVSQFWNSRRKRSVSSSSSSFSEKVISPESSFSSKSDKDNDNGIISTSNEADQLESQKDVLQTVSIGKRKYPIKKCSTGKKYCGDEDANSSTEYDEHPHKLIRSNSGGNAGIPEVSGSSRTSTSPPSSDKWQKNKSSCRR